MTCSLHEKITHCIVLIVVMTNCLAQAKNSGLRYDAYLAATFDLFNNKPFVSLELEDTAGQTFNTSSLRGKTIYADFWFTACPPCLKEIPYAKALQQFFAPDTNIVFLSICIENIERKAEWKQMIKDKEMGGIQLFYTRNRPQKINLLKEYKITFPTYLLVDKQMKVIGYDAPRPSQKGWVHWAISQARDNILLSGAYKKCTNRSRDYIEFLNKNADLF